MEIGINLPEGLTKELVEKLGDEPVYGWDNEKKRIIKL